MIPDRVTIAVLEAARTHRAEAAQLELIYPGTKVWHGEFTSAWWAYVPRGRHAVLAGPADSTVTLRRMILTAHAQPAQAGTRAPLTTPDPALSAAWPSPAADRAARGAEPPASPAGSAPRNHRGGRHARR